MELAKEQKALIEKYKEEWLNVGYKTGHSTKEEKKECEKKISSFYEYSKKNPPKNFIWVSSPYEAGKLINNWSKIAEKEKSVEKILENLRSKEWKSKYIQTNFWGSLDSYWISFYLCGQELAKKQIYSAEEQNQLDGFAVIAKSAFWWYPYSETCIISERPIELNMKDGKLHADGKMARKFSDGFGDYFLNGVRMPKELVITPKEKLNGKKAAEIDDVDVRREFLQKIGLEKFIKDANATVVDIWEMDKKNIYTLLSVDLGKETGAHLYLKMSLTMKDKKEYFFVEGVADTCKTAKEAFYWRYPQLNGANDLPVFLA